MQVGLLLIAYCYPELALNDKPNQMLYKLMMKILFQSNDHDEIEQTKMLMESKGIPVFVANESTATNLGPLFIPRGYILWVALDEQFEDAKAVLKDKHHAVSNPVDIENFHKMEDQLRTKNTKHIFYGLILSIILLLIACYVIFSVHQLVSK